MWIWVNSGNWWWTGRCGVLQFMGSQRVGHNWATELNCVPGKYSILLEYFQVAQPFQGHIFDYGLEDFHDHFSHLVLGMLTPGFGGYFHWQDTPWSVPGHFHKPYPKSSRLPVYIELLWFREVFFSCFLQPSIKRIIVTRGQSRNETQVMLCNNYDCGQCVGFLSDGIRPSGFNC